MQASYGASASRLCVLRAPGNRRRTGIQPASLSLFVSAVRGLKKQIQRSATTVVGGFLLPDAPRQCSRGTTPVFIRAHGIRHSSLAGAGRRMRAPFRFSAASSQAGESSLPSLGRLFFPGLLTNVSCTRFPVSLQTSVSAFGHQRQTGRSATTVSVGSSARHEHLVPGSSGRIRYPPGTSKSIRLKTSKANVQRW